MLMEAAANFRTAGRLIVGIGRNYAAHAAELGNAVPKNPILFSKPTTAFLDPGCPIRVPDGCHNLHYEVELGVVVGAELRKASVADAAAAVGGFCLALDMTARDFQDLAKAAGTPWFVAKGFDGSCPVSAFLPPAAVPEPQATRLWLDVNGERRQDGNTKDMLFQIPALLSHISRWVTLRPGDVILTGTPSGVGQVRPGDVIRCGLGDDIVQMEFRVEGD